MQISNIDASLSQGNILDKKQFFALYFAMVVCLIIPLITIILLFIPQVEWESTMIVALSISNIIFLSFLSVLIYIIIKNNKIKKKTILWIEDAVELLAYSKQMGENRLGIQPKAVKIQVKFNLENKVYTRESTAKVFGGQQGYLGTFNKYINKEIRILYSPKYDEVLILKDKTK